jgi:hypothetical protein
MAKLKADMLRVQATVPLAALVEAWDVQRWQEVHPGQTICAVMHPRCLAC